MVIEDFRKILVVKRYSANTIKVYTSVIKGAKNYFQKSLSEVSEDELHEYFYNLIHAKQVSYSYQKQIAVGLKLFYSEMYKRAIHLEFLMPKFKPKTLPVILSQIEVLKLISFVKNIKHKSMIALAYGSGLRVSELLNLGLIR